MLDQSWFSIMMRSTVWMGQAPVQVPGRVVVVVVLVETVVVVGPGQALPAGMHSSVTLSTSIRAGLWLDLAATRIVHACIFLPFLLVRALMSTNEPQDDSPLVILRLAHDPVRLSPGAP